MSNFSPSSPKLDFFSKLKNQKFSFFRSLYIIFRVFPAPPGENFPDSRVCTLPGGGRVFPDFPDDHDNFLDGCAKTNCCNCCSREGWSEKRFPARVCSGVCVCGCVSRKGEAKSATPPKKLKSLQKRIRLFRIAGITQLIYFIYFFH